MNGSQEWHCGVDGWISYIEHLLAIMLKVHLSKGSFGYTSVTNMEAPYCNGTGAQI